MCVCVWWGKGGARIHCGEGRASWGVKRGIERSVGGSEIVAYYRLDILDVAFVAKSVDVDDLLRLGQ